MLLAEPSLAAWMRTFHRGVLRCRPALGEERLDFQPAAMRGAPPATRRFDWLHRGIDARLRRDVARRLGAPRLRAPVAAHA